MTDDPIIPLDELRELAPFIGSRAQLLRMLNADNVPHFKVGRSRGMRRSDFVAWLESKKTDPTLEERQAREKSCLKRKRA